MQVSYVSRKSGSSAVRHAAYRAGERIWDERANRTRDFRNKRDVVHAEILAPGDAPPWMRDRSRLWNGVEAAERRKDSRLAQEVYVAIPREVRPEKRIEAVREFVQKTFVAKGMIADFAIHAPTASDGREDPHVHVLLSTRSIDGNRFGRKCRSWDHPARVAEYRLAWERHANLALARSGSIDRVDARSLRAQKRGAEERLQRAIARRDRVAARQHARAAAILDRIPEISLGRAASHMEKRGRRTARGDRLREIRERNERSRNTRIRHSIRDAMREIGRLERADWMARFRTSIEESAIHALPAVIKRRIYLRRNQRLLARAGERFSGTMAPPGRLPDPKARDSQDRGLAREGPRISHMQRRGPPERIAAERNRSERQPRAPDPAALRIPAEQAHPGLRRNGPRAADARGRAVSGGRESPGSMEIARPDHSGASRRPATGKAAPGDETGDTGAIHEVRKHRGRPREERRGMHRSQAEAQELLQQWLDGNAQPASRTPQREKDLGLERG